MSQNDHPEVIDPNDRRYKDEDYFKNPKQPDYSHSNQAFHYSKNIGCGCGPFGCLSGCITLILLSSLITFLLNFLF
ncbi:hypothetical protein QI037_04530 [Staphylococcus saprophyticus]|uniref:hypothetical protein n=1 Tax=Staphylococcus saprophyticus TaxID=29385 RepID=UPI000853907F|nr:hypothetical protein [Staphylococcus saprophyticus]MBU8680010.1 hypothetical protein [Staphylococcus saprophyticus]MCT1652717.1 hypothetical protein [Staphylococcus saprophyticus]MDW3789990.1 hypothetical protein [Staphylococcus saprophyticus]MDW3799180.1 hypothetical protein [Staphylococcus saprophyticus]MDW3801615.1 hypothetical protein [Staphylococcus saprophyticus]